MVTGSKRPLIYRYQHNGNTYYGQGLNEEYVRQALADKIKVPHDELSVGDSKITEQEFLTVAAAKLDYDTLDRELGIDKAANKSISKLVSITKLPEDFIRSKVSSILKIPRSIVDNLNDHAPIKVIVKHSNLRVKVKTYRIPNKEIPDSQFLNNMGSEPNDPISRVDEINEHINMLLSLDYQLFHKIDDVEYELQKAQLSYENLNDKLKTVKSSHPKYQSYVEELDRLNKSITKYKERVSLKYNRMYSTGYYVSDTYLHDNYDEVLEGFEIIYSKIKSRLKRHYLQNVVPKGEILTLEEKLDSFWLTLRQKNYIVKPS